MSANQSLKERIRLTTGQISFADRHSIVTKWPLRFLGRGIVCSVLYSPFTAIQHGIGGTVIWSHNSTVTSLWDYFELYKTLTGHQF